MNKKNKVMNNFKSSATHYEIERKFLIDYPDSDFLNKNNNVEKSEIIQCYLLDEENIKFRVRRRGTDGKYIYTKTVKQRISGIKCIETEYEITEQEYNDYIANAKICFGKIQKDRFCYYFDNQCFEIDVYPFWSDKAVMEIELDDENQKVIFPENIKIIKEVTDDKRYKNFALALNQGKGL